jgi:hypothetical protein
MKSHRRSRSMGVFFFLTSALDEVGGQRPASTTLPPGKDPVPIVYEAGWASGLFWTGVEKSPSPGFYPRTFQPVAGCCTDCAIPAHNDIHNKFIYFLKTYFRIFYSLFSFKNK